MSLRKKNKKTTHMALKIQYVVVPTEKASNSISFSYAIHIKLYYRLIEIKS